MAGFVFACHGAQKLFGVLRGLEMRHVSLMLAAGIIEFSATISLDGFY